MTVESLDTCENLAVVSARDQDLCARADGGLEDGEGTGGELMFFDLSNFVLGQLRTRLGQKLLELCVHHGVELCKVAGGDLLYGVGTSFRKEEHHGNALG